MADQHFTPEELAAEEWRTIPGSGGTRSVSTLGRVRIDRSKFPAFVGRINDFSGMKLKYAWAQICMDGHGKQTSDLVHRIVVETYLRKIEEGECVNHIDGDKRNNRLLNLEIVTPAGNAAHASRAGLLRSGVRHHAAKLSENDVLSILAAVRSGRPKRAVAREFGIDHGRVHRIVIGRLWSTVTGVEKWVA